MKFESLHVEKLIFFSSRRRHTRSKRDWSSDVCSSDLAVIHRAACLRTVLKHAARWITAEDDIKLACLPQGQKHFKIGRASCRERVLISSSYIYLKEKNSLYLKNQRS